MHSTPVRPKQPLLALPDYIDETAKREPDAIWALIPRSNTNVKLGCYQYKYAELARAVDDVVWWIEKEVGILDYVGQTIGYMGVNNLNYLIVLAATLKVGYVPLFVLPRNSIDGQVSIIQETDCRFFLTGAEMLPPQSTSTHQRTLCTTQSRAAESHCYLNHGSPQSQDPGFDYGSKRARERSHSLSDGDDDAPSPRKVPHIDGSWPRRDSGSFNNPEHLRENNRDTCASEKSHSCEPVKTVSPPIRPPRTPALQNAGPAARGLVKIRFAQVPSDEVLTEINIAEVSSGSTVSWEKLTSVARSLSAFPGFCFTHALYLSPREKQKFAITHQGLLNTALEDFPPGTVPICTTQPVGAGGPTTSDPIDAVPLLSISGGLNAPQHLHPRALGSGLPVDPLSTWDISSRPETDSRGISTFPTHHHGSVRSPPLSIKRDSARKESDKSNALVQSKKPATLPKNSPDQHEGTPGAVDNTPLTDRASDSGGKRRPEAPLVVLSTAKHLHERVSGPPLPKDGSAKGSGQPFGNCEVIDLTSDGAKEQPEADRARKDEAGCPQDQSNTTRAVDVSTTVETDQREEEEEEEEEEGDDEPEDSKEADARAIAAAAEYTLSLADATTARQFAAKTNIKYWIAAADVYGLPVSALQVPHDMPKVRMPATAGLSPDFEAFPHQYVGSNEVFKASFGPMRGCILADEMGFGKTSTTLLTYIINFFGVAKTMSGIPLLEALTFPRVDKGGTINGIQPRVGATFVSASAQGVESWPESWVRIMSSSKALREFPAAWRPKLVLLHVDGAKYCEKHGGERAGLYSAMTREEWAEVLPQPDWDNKSRTPQGQAALGNPKWTGPSDWPASPGATVDRPALTSTRYIIVCTNQSWRSRVTCTWSDNAASRDYKTWVKTLNAPSPGKKLSQKARIDLEQEISKEKTEYFQKKGHMSDGFGPTQARRPCQGTNAKGTAKNGFKICDLAFGAWIVVDEIHAAAGEHTITYTEVVNCFRQNRSEEDWPGVTGITGSPLANGIGTTGVFVANVLQRKTGMHEAVRALASFSLENFMGAWSHLQRTFKSAQKIRSKTKRQQYVVEQLADNGKIQQMNQIFASQGRRQ